MVAAWINAETGVGPAIASANQVCNGSCADLPTAPPKTINIAQLMMLDPAVSCSGASTAISRKLSVPN